MLALLATSAGCLSLPEKAPAPRRWILSTNASELQVDSFSVTLGLGPVDVPSYLDRNEIVERLGPNELRANAFEIWAEPLDVGIRRVLTLELVSRVPGLAVVTFPWKGPADIDERLTMVVTRFEHDIPNQVVELQVGWALSDARKDTRIASRLQTVRVPVEGDQFAAVPDAMSRALAEVAQAIAAEIEQSRSADPEPMPGSPESEVRG